MAHLALGFSADGKRIAFVHFQPTARGVESSLMVQSSDGSGRRALITRTGSPNLRPGVSWSNEDLIAVVDPENILIVPAAGGPARRLPTRQPWHQLESVAWHGDALLVTSEEQGEGTAHHQIYQVSFPKGDAHRLTSDLNDYHSLSVSSQKENIVCLQLSGHNSVWLFPLREPAQAQPITTGVGDGWLGVMWIDDRELIESDAGGAAWFLKDDGSGRRKLETVHNPVMDPSRCGSSQIVYSNGRGDNAHVWIASLDGSSSRQLTNGAGEYHPSCSPDGKWVYFTFNHDRAIAKVSAAGGAPSQVLTGGHDPHLSPDGKWIAFHSQESDFKKEHMAISPVDGGPLRILEIPVTDIFGWSSDSKAVVYVEPAPSRNLWKQPINGGAPVQLSHFSSDRIAHFDWTPDGKRLLLTRFTASVDAVMIGNW